MRNLVAIFLLMFMSIPAEAGIFSCGPTLVWQHLLMGAKERTKDAELTTLSEKETAAYLEEFNAEPPETHLKADHILILTAPRHPILIGFVTGDVTCVVTPIANNVHEKALIAARGEKL